jgi:ubiquinone/menaquinone biosynthesis C-methylase UbiE
MSQDRDVDRFGAWAETYDRHWMQRSIFTPVQQTVMDMAAREVPRPMAILDVGCGTGRLLRLAESRFPEARLVGVDAALGMVKQAEASRPPGSETRFQQSHAEDLPFGDAEFDLVFSTLTFHHWHDQARGIAEVARVLAPGGRWLLADFIPTGPIRIARRLFRLTRFRERPELAAMLLPAGLAIVAELKVRRLGGQVPVLAIAARARG